MLWWQWLLTFGIPILIGGLGLLLGKLSSLKYSKNHTKPLFKSRRTSYAKQGCKTITFDQFLNWYAINPKKWDWSGSLYSYQSSVRDYVTYIVKSASGNELFDTTVKLYWETYRDGRKFNKWVEEYYNKKLIADEEKGYKRVLEDIQKDVKIKMDAIQKEYEEELKRIEAERKENQDKYKKLANQLTNISRSASISATQAINNFSCINYSTGITANGDKYITQYSVLPETKNIVFVDIKEKPLLKDNDYRLMYEGQLCEYFETTCGTSYIHTPDGKFLEVVFK